MEENGSQAGIRLVNEEQRQFMNLAVEEWTAQYKIPVQYPLFFEWVVDPEWNLQVAEASLDSQLWYGVATMAGVAVVLTFLVRFQFLFTMKDRAHSTFEFINQFSDVRFGARCTERGVRARRGFRSIRICELVCLISFKYLLPTHLLFKVTHLLNFVHS